MRILYESKDRELKYVKNKYESLCKRYNDIEWKYNELLLNSHYSREHYKKLEKKYNNLHTVGDQDKALDTISRKATTDPGLISMWIQIQA